MKDLRVQLWYFLAVLLGAYILSKLTGSGEGGEIYMAIGVPGFVKDAFNFGKDLLFGEDPGSESRDVLQKFGITGKLGDTDPEKEASALLNSTLGQQSAVARKGRSARLARAGIAGTGLEEDALADIELQSSTVAANELRRIRLGLINQRLAALGGVSQTPPTQGLVGLGVQAAVASQTGGS